MPVRPVIVIVAGSEIRPGSVIATSAEVVEVVVVKVESKSMLFTLKTADRFRLSQVMFTALLFTVSVVSVSSKAPPDMFVIE